MTESHRSRFLAFGFINTLAFGLLAGQVIMLYLERLGVSYTLLGTVSSFVYVSYFFMPIGRFTSRRWGMVRSFGSFWFIRFFTMVPLLFSPILAQTDPESAGIVAVLSFLAFQTVRGFGIVGYTPLLGQVSKGDHRARFVSQTRIVMDVAMVASTVFVAAMLPSNASLERYQLFFALGIGLGISSALILLSMKDLDRGREAAQTKQIKETIGDITGSRTKWWYFVVLASVVFANSWFRPFLLIHAKRGYGWDDQLVLILIITGNVGSVIGALLNRRLIDKHGSKPMVRMFLIMGTALALGAALASPTSTEGWGITLFLGALFFFGTMVFFSVQNALTVYFYRLFQGSDGLDEGIIMHLVQGISGLLGGFLSGLLADNLASGGLNSLEVNRVVFAAAALLYLLSLGLSSSLAHLGSGNLRQLVRTMGNDLMRIVGGRS